MLDEALKTAPEVRGDQNFPVKRLTRYCRNHRATTPPPLVLPCQKKFSLFSSGDPASCR